MKFVRRFFLGLVTVLIVLVAVLYIFNYDYLLKAVRTIYFTGHTTAYLEDYKQFENMQVASGKAQPWSLHKNYNQVNLSDSIAKIHREQQSVAFLVFKNDSLLFEEYYDDYNKTTRSNSFSMAKSYVSALLGKAILQGHIKSLDQPVGDFIPEYSTGLAGEMTVGDLASMASGLDWDESYYSPFSVTTRAYFDDNLAKVMRNLEMETQPGQRFKYLSGNTELLAMVIEEATGMKMADYLSESFWKPLGAETDALWQIDSEQHQLVKAYCCIASNARDFARLGKLYKNHGKWNGRQLLDSAYVARSIRPRFKNESYGYGFWLKDYKGKECFMMRGHLGQYVIVVPQDDLMLVRLGHTHGKKADDGYPREINAYLDEAYNMLKDAE